MRHSCRKLLAIVIAVVLVFAGTASQTMLAATGTGYRTAEFGQEPCPHLAADQTQSSAGIDACQTFCAVYHVASLPAARLAEPAASGLRNPFPTHIETMVAHRVPTEPGIPKTV